MNVSKAVLRLRTERAFLQRRKKFGDHHPATIAAYARAQVAWENMFLVKTMPVPTSDNAIVYHVARTRAATIPGYRNRRWRRRFR